MMIEDLGCLLVNNRRSGAYLQKLIRNSLIPSFVVFFDKQKVLAKKDSKVYPDSTSKLISEAFRGRKYFLYDPAHKNNAIVTDSYATPKKYATWNIEESIIDTLEKNNIQYVVVKASSINAQAVIDALREAGPKYFVFGGGGILRREILSIGKKFIHIHPGMVPYFKGSHCIEWSILCGKPCAASAFYMVEKIDEGDIIAQQEFECPELENNNVAPLYSSNIRSELLVKIIKDFVGKGRFITQKQNPAAGETYYKMHPVLMNLVLHKLHKMEKTVL